MKKILFLLIVLIWDHKVFAQEFNFTSKAQITKYQVGKAQFKVQRIEEHQIYIKTLNVSYSCDGGKIWFKHFYQNGLCEIESVNFERSKNELNVKYYDYDLSTGDEYLCQKNAEYLTIKLTDKCKPK